MDMLNTITYRSALPEDAELILDFIRRLAEYEKMADQVTATPRLLKEWIFEKQKAEVIFAMVEGLPCFSTTFPHSWASRVCTWKTSLCSPNTGAGGVAVAC